MRRCTRVLLCSVLGLIAVTIGCASSSNNAKIRLVNAMPDESNLDLLVDSKSVASGVGYGSASAYASVASGARHSQVEPSGTTTILIDRTDTVSTASNLSLVSLDFSFNPSSVLLTDDNSAPASGNFKLRIVNASPGMGAQDVYVVTFGTTIDTVDPTFSSVGFGSATTYSALAAGDYDVIFTPPQQKFINLDSGKLTLSAGQIRTLLALNNPAGAFMFTLLSDAN